MILLLLLVTAAGTVSYHFKFRGKPDDMDRLDNMAAALLGAQPQLTTLSIGGTADITLRSQVRYAFAPRVVLSENSDTTLAIYSLQDTLQPTDHIVWQHNDDKYKYFVTIGSATR